MAWHRLDFSSDVRAIEELFNLFFRSRRRLRVDSEFRSLVKDFPDFLFAARTL